MSYETRNAGGSRDMDRLPLAIAFGGRGIHRRSSRSEPGSSRQTLRFELGGKRSGRRGNYRVIYEIFETAV